jgi:hypothetical protein
MANATRTITIADQFIFGNVRINMVKVSCTSYQSDGILLSAADCGLAELDYVFPFFVGIGSVANDPVSVWWDKTDGVLLCYKSSATATDNGTVISTTGYIYCMAIGS